MTNDMSRYLGLFLSEAAEHLEGLGRDLVQLEREGAPGVVDSMFRHAHSVKGMASSMGFEPIAVLAHRVEDLVDAIRKDPRRLERGLVDLLLSATDVLSDQVRAVGESRSLVDSSALLAQLAERVAALTGREPAATRILRSEHAPASPAVSAAIAAPMAPVLAPGAPVAPPAVPEAPAAPAATARGAPGAPAGDKARWAVQLRIAPTCQVPGVRAFLVHKRLTGLGTLFDLRPPLEELKAGRIPEGLIQVDLETALGMEAVQKALRNISEVELTLLQPVTPAPPPPPAEAAPRAASSEAAVRTVRVRTELLDYFLDTVGELMLATARLRELAKALPEGHRPSMEEGVDRLNTIVKDLHDKVMGARMTPLSVVTDRLPRAARDIARRTEREVDLVVTGAEIELDRAILDELADPLLHLLRNCIDHGLEPPEERVAVGKPPRGRVQVTVRRASDRVVVEMEDDGRGMNPARLKVAAVERGALAAEAAARMSDREALMLACLPGVSTARDVSEISGRGVGMDAVKRVVETVGGTLEIESTLGKGTRFILRLPLTVAVVHLLLVQVGDEVYGLPVAKVVAALEADGGRLARSRDTALLPHDGALLTVHSLEVLVGQPVSHRQGVRPYVVIEGDPGRVALAVDRLLGQEEAVLKPLSRPLDLLPGLSGVTILGSGRPVFILDVPRLISS